MTGGTGANLPASNIIVQTIKGQSNMRYSRLSDAQISQAIHETDSTLDALVKYQNFLATGAGLPKNDAARIELMETNVKMAARLRTELDGLKEEQSKRLAT
jgi:hypothetical protein